MPSVSGRRASSNYQVIIGVNLFFEVVFLVLVGFYGVFGLV